MRIGLFSDTHANLEALEAVLDCFAMARVDKLVCLGDTVGYGADPNGCCDLVRKHAAFCILGNHDAAVAGRMDYSYYYDAARQALDYHASILTQENMVWLKSLPYERREGHICFCHGSPINLEEFEYIFSTEQAARCLPFWDQLSDVTFVGHSHLCKAFALSRHEVHEVVAQKFEIRPGYKYIIASPPSSPVPFLIARSIVSLGMLESRALSIALRRRGLPLGSPPPRAATVTSLMSFVQPLDFLASEAAFWCLILDQRL